MKKLRLDQDDLRVESFTTVNDGAAARGTVFGRATWATCEGMETCYPYNTCAGTGCGSGYASCGCGWSEATCSHIHSTCQQTCNCGLTYTCATGQATDCPGMTECAPYTEDVTCYGSCTDQGCTACGAVC
ncbi:MAG TPA: hypothetical protein VNP72_01125 [Longimicrobium sp.]|nr:hypothetical protein [Longimicrobium sp.]